MSKAITATAQEEQPNGGDAASQNYTSPRKQLSVNELAMYQTRTIAGILEPVAQQVSKLIILHEEGEDGNAMPDLEKPVYAVSSAVSNLLRVGKETINSSQDNQLRGEMPKALTIIESASSLLEQASQELKRDPTSQHGRDKLISGSRGILQGTTAMLMTFDESQVRKLCRDCKRVLDYLAISEVIETMEDLVQFVKDLSPCLSKVTHDVDARRKDLLNQYHYDSLGQHLEQIKTLAPILICSMKIFIQIQSQEGKGNDEAVENRNYLAKRMTEEIAEIIKTLEEPGRSGSNLIGSISLTEMTFHELLKKIYQLLASPEVDKTQMNQRTIQHAVDLGFKIADGFEGHVKADLIEACNELDRINRQVGNNLNDPRSRKVIGDQLRKMEANINTAIINRIMLDMADISTPLKQFSDAVMSHEVIQVKRDVVEQRAQSLKIFSNRLSKTANLVAFANARNRRRSESLHHLSSQIQNLTPQLINAGTIKMNYPENRAAEENFENLRRQFADGVQTIRDYCDESMDLKTFLTQTEYQIRRVITMCDEGIRNRQSQLVLDNTAMAARLSNRLLAAILKEHENSEDNHTKMQLKRAADQLKVAITPFVENSRAMSNNLKDQGMIAAWKSTSNRLLEAVAMAVKQFGDVSGVIEPPMQMVPQPPPMTQRSIPVQMAPPSFDVPPPPRPPLPEEAVMPPRPPMPDTDDEEGLFTSEPGSNRPIHVAAHGLYQEVKQWDHSDNEIIAAAKKIAYLMAHLSELIRPGKGTKRDLIACAKGLADAADRITELCKELARHCTDKKIRTNLLQVCEKIPTLGTQLRVLSTVKATMMGNMLDTEEDQEAMDMLVFNAQKLNQAVKETVRAAEAASIRVRSDAGFKLRWVRKQPWHV